MRHPIHQISITITKDNYWRIVVQDSKEIVEVLRTQNELYEKINDLLHRYMMEPI